MSTNRRNTKKSGPTKAELKKMEKQVREKLAQVPKFFFWNVSGTVEYIHEGQEKSKTLNVFHRSHRPMVLAELEQANLKLYATFQERTKLKLKLPLESEDLKVEAITMLAVSYLGTFTQEQWREGIQMPQEATQEAPQTTEQPSPAVTPAT